jgi:hypothetical protein
MDLIKSYANQKMDRLKHIKWLNDNNLPTDFLSEIPEPFPELKGEKGKPI